MRHGSYSSNCQLRKIFLYCSNMKNSLYYLYLRYVTSMNFYKYGETYLHYYEVHKY